MAKSKTYYLKVFRCLRKDLDKQSKALDELIGELEQESAPVAKRQRRNLKQVRVENHEVNYATGTWRKPAQLRKQKA